MPITSPDTLSADMEAVARRMVADNTDDDQHTIQAAYLFPSDTEEIRLIYVDSTAYPSRDDDHVVKPFYFGADAASGVPFRSAVALVRPEEKDVLRLPDGWGTWSDAVLLYAQPVQETPKFTANIGSIKHHAHKIDEAALVLLCLGILTSHTPEELRDALDNSQDGEWRVWKEMDWGVLDRLGEKGYITNFKNKNKSLLVTDEGVKEALRVFQENFGA